MLGTVRGDAALRPRRPSLSDPAVPALARRVEPSWWGLPDRSNSRILPELARGLMWSCRIDEGQVKQRSGPASARNASVGQESHEKSRRYNTMKFHQGKTEFLVQDVEEPSSGCQ